MGRIAGAKVALPDVRIGGPARVITVMLIDGPDEHTMPGIDGYLGTASLHANSKCTPKRRPFYNVWVL
jgi:hypothetical protein